MSARIIIEKGRAFSNEIIVWAELRNGRTRPKKYNSKEDVIEAVRELLKIFPEYDPEMVRKIDDAEERLLREYGERARKIR